MARDQLAIVESLARQRLFRLQPAAPAMAGRLSMPIIASKRPQPADSGSVPPA